MNKLPAFQFYPADWKKDIKVQSLSFEERGIWFEMLCLMHESEKRGMLILNGNAIDDKTIARLIGCDFKMFAKALSKILSLGVAYKDEKNVIYNKRMVQDERLMQMRREVGKKGGNPNLVNKTTKNNNFGSNLVNQNFNQSLTPSASSSSSITKEASSVDVFEVMRRQLLPSQFSDNLIREEAIKFATRYRDENIKNAAALISTWISKLKPDIQPKRFTN